MPPFPGIKIDYRSYLLASPEGRAWMACVGRDREQARPARCAPVLACLVAPAWAAWFIVGYELFIIGTDVFISTRRSDWKRVRRELRVARQQASAR